MARNKLRNDRFQNDDTAVLQNDVTPEVTEVIEDEHADLAHLPEQTRLEAIGGREALKKHTPNLLIENDVSGQVRGNPRPPENITINIDHDRVPTFSTPGRAIEQE